MDTEAKIKELRETLKDLQEEQEKIMRWEIGDALEHRPHWTASDFTRNKIEAYDSVGKRILKIQEELRMLGAGG
jgi:hypothetical protein